MLHSESQCIAFIKKCYSNDLYKMYIRGYAENGISLVPENKKAVMATILYRGIDVMKRYFGNIINYTLTEDEQLRLNASWYFLNGEFETAYALLAADTINLNQNGKLMYIINCVLHYIFQSEMDYLWCENYMWKYFMDKFKNIRSVFKDILPAVIRIMLDTYNLPLLFVSQFLNDSLSQITDKNQLCEILQVLCGKQMEYGLFSAINSIIIQTITLHGEHPTLVSILKQFHLKNELVLYIASSYTFHTENYFSFLIEKCLCDPNYQNKYGEHVMHYIFLYRGFCPRSETMKIIRIYLENGFHVCMKSSLQRFINLNNYYFPELRLVVSLKCLSALKIVDDNLDYKSLPLPLQEFVKHH